MDFQIVIGESLWRKNYILVENEHLTTAMYT